MSIEQKIQTMFPRENEIPEFAKLPKPVELCEYLIDGELRKWNGPFQEVTSPIEIVSEGGVLKPARLGHYPRLGEKQAMEALDAACRAWDNGMGAWPTMGVDERIRAVLDFVRRMKERRTEVARLLMWEIGKNKADSEKEFDRTIDYLLDTIEALKDLDRTSSRFTIQQGIIGQIRRAPLGVVLSMGPFNYPLNETFTTLLPALIMGNTVVVKPAKFGVLLFGPLMEAFHQSFPKGVVNFVFGEGPELIPPLMASGKVDVLAFIGSSRVADQLKKAHPNPHRLLGVLGLDAKNPGIILGDADLDLAVKECLLGSLSYNGQRCTALKILFVERKVVDVFLQRFSAGVEALSFGMPWENAALTPLPETGKTDYLSALVKDAEAHGAKVVNPHGGLKNGTFFFPAVLCAVNAKMRVYHEEQFGPVVPIVPFDDIHEPLEYIIQSKYGQQASLFGSDPERLARLVDPLVNQVSRLNLNSQCQRGPDTFPFTGRKDSAERTLSVSDALRVFSIRTLVAAKAGALNEEILNRIVRERRSKFLSTDYIF